jgi:ABC-type Mn2+/Zn2+ transport system ATPase subunit
VDITDDSTFTFSDLGRISVLLGKNGSGKSTLLKRAEQTVSGKDEWGTTRYITPERGGALIFDASTEQQSSNDPTWIQSTRRVNQYIQFRQQTMVQYRKLELSVLRSLEEKVQSGEAGGPGFEDVLNSINGLLDNLEIRRDKTQVVFSIHEKTTGAVIPAAEISSGESELISLGIECLVFGQEALPDSENLLCLDEPDVHLHPDLQYRFTRFLRGLADKHGFRVLIATHSTALLGGLADYEHAAVGLMKIGETDIGFQPIDDTYRRILPVFGAHPLSNVFNEAPVLLVEGEDDERIWQQAVRSSQGALKLYPVACGSVDIVHDYEQRVKDVIDAVYDNARALSLRDRDETSGEMDDLPPVVRLKLACRSAENLLVSDEVLSVVGLTWAEVEERIEGWLTRDPDHPRHGAMQGFKDGGYDRKAADLKDVRMLLVGEIFASNKPWEVLVGQALGQRASDGGATEQHSLDSSLGAKAVEALFGASS